MNQRKNKKLKQLDLWEWRIRHEIEEIKEEWDRWLHPEKYEKPVIEEIDEAYRTDLIGIREYWLLTGNYEIVK